MQVDINSGASRPCVVSIKVQERIKCRSWVRVQKCFPQSRLAHFAHGQLLPFIPGITKTQLPIPCLEIVAKLSHLTAQANIEQIIAVGELFVSRTGVIDAAKQIYRGYGEIAPVRKEIWNSRIRDREGVKRILKWHTDTGEIKPYVSAWGLEWIGRKLHSVRRRIEK